LFFLRQAKTAFLSYEQPPPNRRPRRFVTLTGAGTAMKPGGGAIHAAAIAEAARAMAAGEAVCKDGEGSLYLWAPPGAYSQVEIGLSRSGGRKGPRPDVSIWRDSRPIAAVEVCHTSPLTAENYVAYQRKGLFVIELDAATKTLKYCGGHRQRSRVAGEYRQLLRGCRPGVRERLQPRPAIAYMWAPEESYTQLEVNLGGSGRHGDLYLGHPLLFFLRQAKTAFLSYEQPPPNRRPRRFVTYSGAGTAMRPGGGVIHAAAVAKATRAVEQGEGVCTNEGRWLYMWAPRGAYTQVEVNLGGGGRQGPRPDVSVWAGSRVVAAVEIRRTSKLAAENKRIYDEQGVFVVEIHAQSKRMIKI